MLVSAQFLRFRSRKEFKKKKENKKTIIKFYSKLYTEFLSVPLFLGSEDESYFTILTLSIYNCQKKLGRIPKKLQVEFLKESPVYCPRSRPQAGVATWISLRLLLISCDLVTSVATRFLAAAWINGRDIVYGRDLVGSAFLKN